MKSPKRNAAPVKVLLTAGCIKRQNLGMAKLRKRKSFGGRSRESGRFGFRPAFIDAATGTIYESRFADGRRAPFHLLDGLPDEVVAERDSCGQVMAAKGSVVAGFVRRGRFHSREEAASLVSMMLRSTPGQPLSGAKRDQDQPAGAARRERAA